MNDRIRTWAWRFLACCALLSSGASLAAELRGRVVAISGHQVRLSIDGELLPQIGDEVTLAFQVPNGPLLSVGTWSVSRVDGDAVTATQVRATGAPSVGQIATIVSPNPVPRSPSPVARGDPQGGQNWIVRFEGRDYRTLYQTGLHEGTPIDLYYYPIRSAGGEQLVQNGELLWGRFVRTSGIPGGGTPGPWWHATWVFRDGAWTMLHTRDVVVEALSPAR